MKKSRSETVSEMSFEEKFEQNERRIHYHIQGGSPV